MLLYFLVEQLLYHEFWYQIGWYIEVIYVKVQILALKSICVLYAADSVSAKKLEQTNWKFKSRVQKVVILSCWKCVLCFYVRCTLKTQI